MKASLVLAQPLQSPTFFLQEANREARLRTCRSREFEPSRGGESAPGGEHLNGSLSVTSDSSRVGRCSRPVTRSMPEVRLLAACAALCDANEIGRSVDCETSRGLGKHDLANMFRCGGAGGFRADANSSEATESGGASSERGGRRGRDSSVAAIAIATCNHSAPLALAPGVSI